MMENCVFCRIINKTHPAEVVHEDDDLIVIHDIHPAAPVHLLVIPRQHFDSLNDLRTGDTELLGRLILTAQKTAHDFGVGESGYRLVINTGFEGGQTVPHLHVHILGGRRMGSNIHIEGLR